jgi:mitochondrial chaperone BCS1
MEFIQYLIGQFYANNFLQAALIAGPVSAVSWGLKEVPANVLNFLKTSTTRSLIVKSDNINYIETLNYLEKIIDERFTRNYTFESQSKWDPANDTYRDKSGINIGFGKHLAFKHKNFFFIERKLEEGNSLSSAFKETITVSNIGISNKPLKKLSEGMLQHVSGPKEKKYINIATNSKSSWNSAREVPLRNLETVFTSDKSKEQIVKHIKNFINKKEMCRKQGTPWHTGIFLSGKPGTGKSSLIHALASEFKKDINYLSLSSIVDDGELLELFSSGKKWENTILVLEDIDAALTMKKREDETKDNQDKISLSGLLNVLDGLMTPDGLIVIATSNYIEKLDKALLRPGRFDICFELKELQVEEFIKMALLFDIPSDTISEMTENYIPTTGAELRTKLLSLTKDV